MNAHTHTHTHAYPTRHTHTQTNTHTLINTHRHTQTYKHTQTNTSTHTHTHTPEHAHTHSEVQLFNCMVKIYQMATYQGFPTRMVYLYYISCLRYTILVGNPRYPSLHRRRLLLLFVGCLTSHKHAGVSQARICSDNCTCCHTDIEVADQTVYLTQHSILTPGQPVPALTL